MEERSKNPDDSGQHLPQEPAAPLPCANGCGFFGSPDTGGLCSKCFRESLRRTEAQPQVSAEPEAVAATMSKERGEQGAKTKSRCATCGRKVGLMGFECRCGGVFCGEHRYSDRHSCGYDYRAAGRDAISQANPVVRNDKVDKF